MKIKFLVGIVLSVIALSSCIKNPDTHPFILLTKSIHVGTATIKYEYDSERRLTIKTYMPVKGSHHEVHNLEFTPQGDPKVKKYVYPTSPENNRLVYISYDSQRRSTDFWSYNGVHTLLEHKTFVYHPTYIEQLTYNGLGSLTNTTFYYINPQGNITRTQSFGPTGILQQQRTLGPFDDQKSHKSLLTSSEGSDLISVNNFLAYSHYDSRTSITQNFTCAYEYNTYGFVTRKTLTNTGSGENFVEEYEYTDLP